MFRFTTTRRSLIQAGAMVSLMGLLSSNGRSTEVTSTRDIDVANLLSRRSELLAECDRLEAQWRAIWPTLPEWCRSGPKYANADGEPYGELVGWPAARVNLIKIKEDQRLARPSPYDLRELYEQELMELTPESAIENYRIRVAQLRVRLGRRRHCYLSWKLPTASDWRPLESEIDRIEVELNALVSF